VKIIKTFLFQTDFYEQLTRIQTFHRNIYFQVVNNVNNLLQCFGSAYILCGSGSKILLNAEQDSGSFWMQVRRSNINDSFNKHPYYGSRAFKESTSGNQCSGSLRFWYGSGSSDPYLRLTDADADPYQNLQGLKDAKKYFFFFLKMF